ncbi:hypothetical protein AB0I00_24985 [Streptomyces sp. NPDC050803]|uniref:hypothetical protein n=1 Tax=unclassified Streptomyces TaxID=2593676 RepID=UPI00343668CC
MADSAPGGAGGGPADRTGGGAGVRGGGDALRVRIALRIGIRVRLGFRGRPRSYGVVVAVPFPFGVRRALAGRERGR